MSTTVVSRGGSLLVVVLYLCLAAAGALPGSVAGPILGGLLFGLPLIWFPEPIGSMTGYMGHGRVRIETPPFLVAFAGWMFLLVIPGLVAILSKQGAPIQRAIFGE
jgi:hypothetical protein